MLASDSYVDAVRDGRLYDAATDDVLHRRWQQDQDTVARALLLLAAAKHDEKEGRTAGLEEKVERAAQYLAEAPGGDAVDALRAYAGEAYTCAERGRALPPIPTDALTGT